MTFHSNWQILAELRIRQAKMDRSLLLKVLKFQNADSGTILGSFLTNYINSSSKLIPLRLQITAQLKRFVCLFLLFMIIMQTFNKVGIVLAFKVNQDYITAAFCENLSRPEMHCNGRCVLAKKLKQAEQNEEKQRNANLEKANILFFTRLSRFEMKFIQLYTDGDETNPMYLQFKLPSYSNDIFKPPQHSAA